MLQQRRPATPKHLLAAAIAAASVFAKPVMAAPPTIDWPTFGPNFHRNNYNPSETVLGTGTVGGLTELWRRQLGAAHKFQPSLVRAVMTSAGTVDLLIVTLPEGKVAALDAANGKPVWETPFKPETITCGGAKGVAGIGEPVTLDIPNGRAFVVDGGGNLHALALATGAEMQGYPVEVIDAANLAAGTWVHYFSPTLLDGNLYLGTSAFGACESAAVPYHGQIIQFSTASLSVVNRYYPTGPGGNAPMLGEGFWGTGGLAVDPRHGGHLWGGTANALPPPQDGGNAEKIVELDTNLNVVAIDGPNLGSGGDLDFGSTPLLFTPAGCPQMLAAMNKTGALVVYDTTKLNAGPTQTIEITEGNPRSKFIGMPTFDPVTNAVYLTNPMDSPNGPYHHGLVALQANASCQLALLWQQPAGPNGNKSAPPTPIIANGVVYFAEGPAGQVVAFDALTGAQLWISPVLDGPIIGSPIVVNGVLYIGAGSAMYAFGLRQ